MPLLLSMWSDYVPKWFLGLQTPNPRADGMTSRIGMDNTLWNRKAMSFHLEFKQYLEMFAADFLYLALSFMLDPESKVG